MHRAPSRSFPLIALPLAFGTNGAGRHVGALGSSSRPPVRLRIQRLLVVAAVARDPFSIPSPGPAPRVSPSSPQPACSLRPPAGLLLLCIARRAQAARALRTRTSPPATRRASFLPPQRLIERDSGHVFDLSAAPRQAAGGQCLVCVDQLEVDAPFGRLARRGLRQTARMPRWSVTELAPVPRSYCRTDERKGAAARAASSQGAVDALVARLSGNNPFSSAFAHYSRQT